MGFIAALTLMCRHATSAPPIVLYDFDSAEPVIQDVAPDGKPLNLTLSGGSDASVKDGAIRMGGDTIAISDGSTEKLIRAIKTKDELTIEVWLTPDNTTQSGPARIVTLSNDTNSRNVTIGQDGDRFDARLRTTKTSTNGIPSLASPPKSVRRQLTHLAFTRSRDGATKLFINGKQVSSGKAAGKISNWDPNAKLAIGDEVSGGRPWKGTLHRVAFFADALSNQEILKRSRGGPEGSSAPQPPSPEELAAAHFESTVAPLLAKHCLECHDVASAEGGLALDRKQSAFEDAIVPGDADHSPLWIAVANDSMPHERAPLADDDKQLLKRWIDDGAAWSSDWIDPADYLHDTQSRETYVRRLTIDEYIRSVQAAVGVDIAYQARKRLPPDLRADGFSNTAYNLTVDLEHVEAYNRLAKLIVAQMNPPEFASKFWGQPKLTDKDMYGLIQKMGTQILRGPLDDAEIVFYRGISTTAASAGGDYGDAVAATIEAMLQSPRFLYRIESQNAEGRTDYLNDYQRASRISFLLWGAPPDSQLMQAASDGELADPSVVKKHVARMLADERAVTRSKDFIAQWLNLNHLNSLNPGAERFAYWNATLAEQMREETLAFFEHVIWKQNRPVADLLNAQVTFCRPELATHYGFAVAGEGLQQYDLSEVPQRGGLLTQGSVLTIGGDDASMVTRGLFVLNQLLRGVVNDPPPCVDTTPIPTAAGVTARTISQARLDNEACGGCHVRFEPLAFGLEKYDGLGAFSEWDEHKNPLREDGNLLVPGTAAPVEFKTAGQLMDLLAASPRVQETLTWKLTQFAIGRPLTSADAKAVREINRRAQASGGTYQAVMTEIITSPLVNPM